MAKGGFPGFGGNMQNFMKQAQKIQKEMEKAQEELSTKTFQASAGGGAVTITVNAKKEITEIKIKREVVDPEDVEMLEDLIRSAANEALRQVDDASDNVMDVIKRQYGVSL